MHGFVNRALQGFLCDTYGLDAWDEVRSQAGLPFDGFESMLHYEDCLTDQVIFSAEHVLHRDRASLLEDVGTYLISHPNQTALRRLMRFGGDSFFDFLQSLDDLSGRARLAVPDLDMPDLDIHHDRSNRFVLDIRWRLPGMGPVFVGALRAMADDYGALAFFEAERQENGCERVMIELLDTAFASGRSFSLGGQTG
ncbi:MAG: heme NO-binding protein [Rhodobacteraceae bacterium CG17_big_fil_post_rev_8_21_14_2_50_65_11]|nr:MAG: heme NO-binding protein [Rhodobacteraceae bacterium CG17_big_fil_post_rev_8_21_14_2_50_65_11]